MMIWGIGVTDIEGLDSFSLPPPHTNWLGDNIKGQNG
jgi:hypothetical protein